MGRARQRHAKLALPLDGERMRLALVADTHGKPHPLAHERLAALQPDGVLHAGDIGDLRVLADLGEVADVHAVRGNIDERAPDLPDTMTIDVTDRGVSILTILLVHIAIHGTRLRAEVAKRAAEVGAGIVVCGHSHVPFAGRDRGVAVFNPGSIGPRRFDLPIVFGVLDVSRERVDVRHVDCETGEPWRAPPRSW